MSKIKPFEQQGHYTQVHNIVFDEIMSQVKPTSFKVLMAIIRKTIGWQKVEDDISFSQLREITGISSNSTLYLAGDELSSLGLIIITKGDYETSTRYRLNTNYEITASENCNTPLQKSEDPPSENCNTPLPKIVNTKDSLKTNKELDPDLQTFLIHFEKQKHVFPKPQTQNAIIAAIGKYGVSDTIAAYERAIENGAENVGIYAAGILRNGGVKSNGNGAAKPPSKIATNEFGGLYI